MSELFHAPLAWSILPANDIIELLFESTTLPVGDFTDSDFTNGVFLIESVNFAAIKDSLFSVALVLYYSLELLCVHNESVLYVPTSIIAGVPDHCFVLRNTINGISFFKKTCSTAILSGTRIVLFCPFNEVGLLLSELFNHLRDDHFFIRTRLDFFRTGFDFFSVIRNNSLNKRQRVSR